jgi:hemolysin activation/secretion protein
MERIWSASVLIGAVLLCPNILVAAPVAPFGAGQILQQVQPNLPAPKPAPPITIHNALPATPAPSGGLSIHVTKFRITGNTRIKTSELHDLVKDGEGKTLTFAGIQSYANRITAFYKKQGFPLTRATLPKQTIEQGVVTILVIEARYGKIRLHNDSRVSKGLLGSSLSNLAPGAVIEEDSLDRDLNLLADIPGIHVISTLSPGESFGTADLDVDVLSAPMVSGNLSVDDYGDPYTGSFRMGGTGAVNNLFHHGDTLTINATTSFGGFEYGRVAYESIVNGGGTKIGAGYSAMDYRLGGGVSPIGYSPNANVILTLGASGYAQTISGWVTQPLIRRTKGDLTLRLGYDHYVVSDTFDQATGADNFRNLDVATVTLNGDRKDKVFGGGLTDGSLSYMPYYLTLGSGSTSANDPFAPTTPGFRSVWRGRLERTQSLPGPGNSFYVSGNGQFATGALDPVEQYVLGGPGSVRGYATAVLFGDQGYTATAELRHLWTWTTLPGTFQSSLFFDAGGVTYATSFLNLMGPGVGESWGAPHGWLTKFEISVPVGASPQVVGATSPVEAWFQVVKIF